MRRKFKLVPGDDRFGRMLALLLEYRVRRDDLKTSEGSWVEYDERVNKGLWDSSVDADL